MKRVVVTGLGMVTPLACGVEATWRRLLAGNSGAARVENFDASDLPCRIAAQVPRGDASNAFDPDDWMDPKEQRRVDDFIVYGMSAATQALRDANWAPEIYEEQIETGVLIGSGIGGSGGNIRRLDNPPRERTAADIAFLHSRKTHQSRERPSLDRPQLERPKPLGRHCVFNRRACDRRRRENHRAWRRECDGGRRSGVRRKSAFACRLFGVSCALDQLQRSAKTGLPPL